MSIRLPEPDDAVPLRRVDPLAGRFVEVGLVGRDRKVRDAPAAHEVVDGDVGAKVADDFRAIQSEWLNCTESVEPQKRRRQRVRRLRSDCANAVPRPSGQTRTSLDGGATGPSMRTSSPNDWSSLSLASEDDRKK